MQKLVSQVEFEIFYDFIAEYDANESLLRPHDNVDLVGMLGIDSNGTSKR